MIHYIEFQTMLVGKGVAFDDSSKSFFVPLDFPLPHHFTTLFKVSAEWFNGGDYYPFQATDFDRVEAMIIELIKNKHVLKSSTDFDLSADIPENVLVCKRIRRIILSE